MTYTPRPIDISHVKLDEEIVSLTEQLAENAHDIWAQKRLSEGWTWGPERSDAEKTNPDLVPYDQLPESEKTYDRDMVTQTIKAIIALGYRIEKPS